MEWWQRSSGWSSLEEGMLSSWLSSSDKEVLAGYVAELDLAIEADDPNAMTLEPEVVYSAILVNLLFVIAPKYVGEIPPPFPA